MRRAVVRAAVSASRVPSTKTSVLGIATKITATSAIRVATPASVRCFSQTLRVADESGYAATPAESQQQSQGEHSKSSTLASSRQPYPPNNQATRGRRWCRANLS